ncbi:hypothetical protein O181_000129 [Austropuccinia psidii MF-1]|uniref:Integrase catalytic domain-containing protein n=1 Tax=Austropuccinia psidii MF-1 TaxID=1389203 RepID=A0A9Q3B801_9BASI|nr:hypothetical protein [Austropuccinia psidii MF-1]
MDWVSRAPTSGERIYSSCLVILDRYRKTPIFLPFHKDDNSMDTALFILNRAISHKGLFENIIIDRGPNFTYSLWTNIHGLFGKKLLFSTEYHPQTDGLAERVIKTLEEKIRIFSLPYKKSIHSSTGHISVTLEKGWNSRLPENTLRKDLIDIHPTASSFKITFYKVKNHAKQSMNDAFDYEKQKWKKSHKVPDFKVGDLALVSTLNFKNIKVPKSIKDSYVGPFAIVALHGTNGVKVEMSGVCGT